MESFFRYCPLVRNYIAFLFVVFAALLAGCGGGGGDSTTGSTSGGDTFVRPTLVIKWVARSRSVIAPSSALSATVILRQASHAGGDVAFSVDRSGPDEGSIVTYTGPEDAKVGSLGITVNFYAGAGATGALVGTANGSVILDANGSVNTTVTTAASVASVEVHAGQSLNVGETRDLTFECRNVSNSLVAVTPGSAHWSVTSGSDKISFQGGSAHGEAAGEANVTATVDGKTSAETLISVNDPDQISVEIEPGTASLFTNQTKQFSATVSGTTNHAVTWAVVEPTGGAISAEGLYRAPSSAGTFTIKATSVVNPSKSATSTVQVQLVAITINPTSASITRNTTKQFAATVVGVSNQEVSWSVIGTGGGSVTTAGLYTAPDAVGTFKVRATSQADPAKHADATVTVTDPPFQIIAGLGFKPAGLPFARRVTGISADGSTVIGNIGLSGADGPGYWTSTSGWVQLGLQPDASGQGFVTAVSTDGRILTGYSPAPGATRYSYRWHAGSGFDAIRDTDGSLSSNYTPVALSDDGSVVVLADGANCSKWTSGAGTVFLTNTLAVRACSGDASILVGQIQNDGQVAGIWDSSGLRSVLGATDFTYMNSSGTKIAGTEPGKVILWSSSGITNVGLGDLISMSRNGKYVIYQDGSETYLWSAGKGAQKLATIFQGVGAPAGTEFSVPAHFISDDGKTIAGGCLRPVGDSTAGFVYVAHLGIAP